MAGNPVENSLTRQGTSRDVATFFDINSLISDDFTPDKLRAIVSSNWLCQKVVGHIPKEMVNVQFSLSLGGQSGKTRSIQDLTMIQDQLRRLMPWFGECQKRANVVGKSYLVIQAKGFKFEEEIETAEEVMVPETTPTDEDVDSDIQFVNSSQGQTPYTLEGSGYTPDPQHVGNKLPFQDMTGQSATNAYEASVRRRRRQPVSLQHASHNFSTFDAEEIGIEQLIQRFPNTFPIDWSNFVNMQIVGADIVDGDMYTWSKTKRFLYRKLSGGAKTIADEEINVRSTLDKWYNADPEGDTNQVEIIHHSHVIEFTAFDYQAPIDQDKGGGSHQPDGYGSPCGGVKSSNSKTASFRLTRFIGALMYYDSFVNSVLNRTHRSEFIAYKKENLGDTNLELARLSANADFSHPAVAAPILDPQHAIEQELMTIANSALNLGVVLVDKSSEIDMVARSFTGIQNVHDVFRPIVIGASGLTEFTLMGLTMASAGLNSHDVRDRMAIAGQVDILFRDTWQPMLENMANTIAASYTTFPTYSYISVKAGASFKLTELEIADVLDKLVTTRLDLVDKGIISREELRAELKGDGLIGKYFVITEPDKATQKEIALNMSLLGNGTATPSTGTPTSATPVAVVPAIKQVKKLNVKVNKNATQTV